MELLVHKDHRVLKELLVHKVHKVLKDHKVLLVLRVHKDRRVHKAQQVHYSPMCLSIEHQLMIAQMCTFPPQHLPVATSKVTSGFSFEVIHGH
jgi:hypothetical protein